MEMTCPGGAAAGVGASSTSAVVVAVADLFVAGSVVMLLL